MQINIKNVYEGYARSEVEKNKIFMSEKSSDELRSIAERVYPEGFLEDMGLGDKVALERIASRELLLERGIGAALDEEKCASIYESVARHIIQKTKIALEQKSSDELQDIVNRVYPAGFLEDMGLTWTVAIDEIASAELLQEREQKKTEAYVDYSREIVEKDKIDMEGKSPNELQEIVNRVYPAGFLEDNGLTWSVALQKIAAAEMLQALGLGNAPDEEACRGIYIGAARDEVDRTKIAMGKKSTDELKSIIDQKFADGFLTAHGLTNRVAIDKIAADEMISERKAAEKSEGIEQNIL